MMFPNLANKKIAIIIPDFDFGGEEKRVVYFLNNYIMYFDSVYLIAPTGLSLQYIHNKVIFKRINIRNVFNVFKVLLFLRKEKIDVLQGHKRLTLPYLFFCEKLLKVKVFFNFDNIYLKFNKLVTFVSPKRLVYLSDVLFNFYKLYYPNSNNTVINMGGDFFEIVSLENIKKIKFDLGITDEIVFICLGRLCKQKNQELLLNSLSMLTFKFKCLIVGDGPLFSEFKSLSVKLHIENKILFLGHRIDIDCLLNVSDALIQASLFEGFPNAIIEAVSLGLPIVATNVGSTSSLVLDNGILINEFDADDLSDAIVCLVDNLEQFKKSALEFKNGNYFKSFHKDCMLDNYLNYINEDIF